MSQLLVGQPSANTSSATAGVLPNHNGSDSSDHTADSIGFSLTQINTVPTPTAVELQAPAEMQVDANLLPQLVSAIIGAAANIPSDTLQGTDTNIPSDTLQGTDTNIPSDTLQGTDTNIPSDTLQGTVTNVPSDTLQAKEAKSSGETPVQGEDAESNVDTPVQLEDTANSLLNPALLSALNFLPLPGINALRPETLQQNAVGLPGFNEAEYSATVLNSNITYSNGKSLLLPGADTALPVTPVSLQHFIRQATEQLRPQGSDSNLLSGISVTQSSGISAAATEPAFQWKADQLGLQSSQWGQKLVYLLSDKINLQLGQQIQRAQIRLDPPQLGLIELSVSVDGDRTTVQLYASNNQMREAMQQNLEQLRQQLAQRLGSEQLLDIDVRQQSQQQSGQQHAASEHIAAHFADDATEINSTPSARLTTGWLNRLV
jgi:flagellar hook-length control protein FliK